MSCHGCMPPLQGLSVALCSSAPVQHGLLKETDGVLDIRLECQASESSTCCIQSCIVSSPLADGPFVSPSFSPALSCVLASVYRTPQVCGCCLIRWVSPVHLPYIIVSLQATMFHPIQNVCQATTLPPSVYHSLCLVRLTTCKPTADLMC